MTLITIIILDFLIIVIFKYKDFSIIQNIIHIQNKEIINFSKTSLLIELLMMEVVL